MADPAGIPAIVPAPPALLKTSIKPWLRGVSMHRVHLAMYGALQFNPGVAGDARFSPICNLAGKPIPTMYAGASFDCAALETVFHDVPFAPGLKTVSETKFINQVRCVIAPTIDLDLVDLGSIALRKLGVARNQLIDTEADTYAQTRKWAEAIHAQCSNAHGLCWTSRQHDAALAVVLFGDRLPAGALVERQAPRDLTHHPADYDEIIDLADRIGVALVP